MLLTGLISGFAAGVAITVLQQVRVTPLILEAETYEGHVDNRGHGAAPRSHGAEGPAVSSPVPARIFFALAANVVMAIALALLLAGAYGLYGGALSSWRGLLWGLGGFAAFSAAPALGLPPELPGAPAGAVFARQTWWVGTAAATAGGLALIVFGRVVWARVVGGVLIVVPHVIGAPHAEPGAPSPLPQGLSEEFVVASLLTSAAFWLILGALSGWLFRRLE
jgi:cobalt transporter subunit CbtA